MVVEVAEVAEVAEAAGVAGVVSEVAEIVGLKPLRSSLRSLKTSKSRQSRDFVATNAKLKRPRAWPGWQMKTATPHADGVPRGSQNPCFDVSPPETRCAKESRMADAPPELPV